MLRPTKRPPTEAELVSHVRRWLNLLGAGQVSEACRELDEPNTYGTRWTPEDVRRAVDTAFPEGSRFRKANPDGPLFSMVDAVSGDGRPSVVPFGDGSGYAVEHDVPLNGQYSDLTAQLVFLWRGNNLAFILHDLHVL